MSLLQQYQKGRGIFRPRLIRWSNLGGLAMSPYAAGILAHYSTSVGNLTSLLTGGMPNLIQKFSPPDQYISAFKEAFKLVRTRGAFLTWDSEEGVWLEAPLSNMQAKPRKVFDKGLDSWEEWFSENEQNFENLHRVFTAAGAGDVTVVIVNIEDVQDLPTHEQFIVMDSAAERHRLGLVM